MAAPDELRFQELEEAAKLLSATPGASTVPGEQRPSEASGGSLGPEESESGDEADSAELLGGQRQPSGFWTFRYYRSFFDVDTQQVLERIKGSVTPLPGHNFVRQRLRSNPDLYGPFWICATLALAVAVSGNLSQVLEQRATPGYRYRPQFHHVPLAASLIFSYAGLAPVALWGFLRWRRSPEPPPGPFSLLETISAYGYSLAAFVPAAVLWLIPVPWLQWLLLAVAALLPGTLLAATFWPPARASGLVTAMAVAGTIVSLHALLAVGCKLYFYQHPAGASLVPALPTLQPEGLHGTTTTHTPPPGTHPV